MITIANSLSCIPFKVRFFYFDLTLDSQLAIHCSMDTFEFSSCVRGHQVYKSVLGEELECRRETDDSSNPYAVAVLKMVPIIGHIPQRISAACSLFLYSDGSSIHCTITGSRRYSSDLPQEGL